MINDCYDPKTILASIDLPGYIRHVIASIAGLLRSVCTRSSGSIARPVLVDSGWGPEGHIESRSRRHGASVFCDRLFLGQDSREATQGE